MILVSNAIDASCGPNAMTSKPDEHHKALAAGLALIESSLDSEPLWRELKALDASGPSLMSALRRAEILKDLERNSFFQARQKLLDAMGLIGTQEEAAAGGAGTTAISAENAGCDETSVTPAGRHGTDEASHETEDTPLLAAVLAAGEQQIATSADDLTRIRGISPDIARRLAAAGYTRFEDIAAWGAGDVARLSAELGVGRQISKENWIEKAAILAAAKAPPPAGATPPPSASSGMSPAGTMTPPAGEAAASEGDPQTEAEFEEAEVEISASAPASEVTDPALLDMGDVSIEEDEEEEEANDEIITPGDDELAADVIAADERTEPPADQSGPEKSLEPAGISDEDAEPPGAPDADAHETLEQRLARLYRQSETLLTPKDQRALKKASARPAPEDTGLARFLERRKASKERLSKTDRARPVMTEPEIFEADVTIVPGKSGAPATPASTNEQNSSDTREKTVPVRSGPLSDLPGRSAAAVPGLQDWAEEASVEIVRKDVPDRRRSRGPTRPDEPQKPIAGRFFKAIKGE